MIGLILLVGGVWGFVWALNTLGDLRRGQQKIRRELASLNERLGRVD